MQVAVPPPVVTTPPPATTTAPAPAVAPVALERSFAAPAGLLFSSIKADQVRNFEMILGRLKDALAASDDPARQRQAEGWKIFRATEAGPAGSVLYVFVMDPAVKDADYSVAKVLAEAYPAEAQELYRLYINAFAGGQTILNLTPAPAPAPVPAAPGAVAPGAVVPATPGAPAR